MIDKKKSVEKEINPNALYEKIEGVYDHPKKYVNIKMKRSLEDIRRKKKIQSEIEQENKPMEIMPSKFDSKEYKEKENKKPNNNLFLILIGVLVIFGLFFVWGVSNDKFKTDFTCPDCNCPQAQLSCPNLDVSQIKQPACICNQTLSCPELNDTKIIDAINNISVCFNSSG